MGLDDFSSDDSGSSSSSTSSNDNTTSHDGGAGLEDNSPTAAIQSFSDFPAVTPRAIKYQIKSVGANWINQYSTKRFDSGEIVMYATGHQVNMYGNTVAVFTTIQSAFDVEPDNENKDIHVVCWDFDEREALEPGIYVSQDDEWQQELMDTVEAQIYKLEQFE